MQYRSVQGTLLLQPLQHKTNRPLCQSLGRLGNGNGTANHTSVVESKHHTSRLHMLRQPGFECEGLQAPSGIPHAIAKPHSLQGHRSQCMAVASFHRLTAEGCTDWRKFSNSRRHPPPHPPLSCLWPPPSLTRHLAPVLYGTIPPTRRPNLNPEFPKTIFPKPRYTHMPNLNP